MNDITSQTLKTGGDPRTLPEYTALRSEISKLTHPARPDVNWRYADELCSSLFRNNGVDLQTAAWYTLARAQLAGISGMNEGLIILETMITHQWGTLWPQPVHARMEILSTLSQRLQQLIRMLPPDYSHLSQLYQAEKLLTTLSEVLQRLELKHISQLDTLRTLIHDSAVRLEHIDSTSETDVATQPDIMLTDKVMMDSALSVNAQSNLPVTEQKCPDSAARSKDVLQPEHMVHAQVQTVMSNPVKKWKSFAAGMGSMLIIITVAASGWLYIHNSDPLQTTLATSLAPLPAPLAPEQIDVLRQQIRLPQDFIAQTQQQLSRLDKLPPDWNIHFSRQLVEQAQMLSPEQANPLAQTWQQQLNATALPTAHLNDWYQGMTTLQKLSDRLNGLDEQKGKYMTVSELKSVVFSAMQSFNQSIPAEEQLRRLSQHPAGEPLPAAASSQLEMHLKQLTARYAEIKQNALK